MPNTSKQNFINSVVVKVSKLFAPGHESPLTTTINMIRESAPEQKYNTARNPAAWPTKTSKMPRQ